MPITVACDARALSDASAYRGVGTYLRHVLGGLGQDPRLEVIGLAPPEASLPPSVRHVPVRRKAPDRLASLEHQLRLPGELDELEPDVVWSPALDPPWRSPAPLVQTIHDLLPLVWTGPGFAVERRRWRRWGQRMRRAAAIIAVSEHTATQCVELLGVARDRIHVVHLAADRRFRPPAGPRAVEDPYVLMVSEYGPHKGYVEAFAVADAIAEAGLPHCLRVAGRITAQTSPVISRLLSGARHPERVELLGWVDDLVPLYQQAAVLLVPSRHEGFGLPAVEAMATATPVVGFANSATTEVVGAGGVLTPDGDVTSMSAAVIGILKDTRRWDEASGAAVGRSRAFDWDRTVAEHAAVLISAARGGSSTPGSADVQAGLRRGEATGQP